MKILLAGPGTGKTTKVKTLVREDYANSTNILVLSFTNATVNDLTESFQDNPNVRCYTLHSYALIINHLKELHILDDNFETPILMRLAEKFGFEFDKLCYFFNCITFDGMVKSCLDFLRANPVYGQEKVGNLDLLIVDEFQDFNLHERELVFELSRFAQETLILGDDDQTIYGFKDADPIGIIDLYNTQSVEKIAHENTCFRCPDVIVDHSKKLIGKNKNRVEKAWKKTGKPGNIFFRQMLTSENTNQFILNEIKTIKHDDPNSSILVLSPVRYYVQELVDLIHKAEIDCVDFWTTKLDIETLKKIWWLRAMYLNQKILHMTLIANTTFSDHFKKKYNDTLKSALLSEFDEAKIITQVVEMFPDPFCDYLMNVPHIARFLENHEEYGVFKTYLNLDEIEESLKTIFQKINPPVEFAKQAVNLMSIHKSKGLQADYVFISGLVDGVLPNQIRGIDTIEAQRRLLFVAMTRSKKSLYILSQVEWDNKYVHKVDKEQFKYHYRKKKYLGRTSMFVNEML